MAALCDNAGIRTQDPRLKRAMLYQLSYIVIRFLRVQKYSYYLN